MGDTAAIVVEEGLTYEGQESIRVRTPSATWVYHVNGCGFASLIDRDGNDWISHHPDGGPRGRYRGIPNMGFAFGHPSDEHAATTRVERPDDGTVRLVSQSEDKAWLAHWDIAHNRAVMTVEKIAAPVWLLYEGTPGGMFRPDSQYWLSSDGVRHPCVDTYFDHLPEPTWAAFCDPRTNRSLLYAYSGRPTTWDTYWPMDGEGGMTVFGLGRSDRDGLEQFISETPFTLTVMLLDGVAPAEIAGVADKLYA